MSNNYIHIGTLNDHSQDHSKHVTINAPGADVSSLVRSILAEDIEPEVVSDETEKTPDGKRLDSFIFTKKAKKEGQIPTIIQAFKSVLANRRDKSRALAQEVKVWQKDEYIDAHYNAQVMYDEIAKIMPLPFGYEAFKQHYNNTRF